MTTPTHHSDFPSPAAVALLTTLRNALDAHADDDGDPLARLLHDVPAACRRVTDAYVWVEAYGLAPQAGHALRGLAHALELIEELDRRSQPRRRGRQPGTRRPAGTAGGPPTRSWRRGVRSWRGTA
jgi:hypothetical protein